MTKTLHSLPYLWKPYIEQAKNHVYYIWKWYVLNKHRIYAGRFLLLSAFQQLSDSKINFPVVSYLLRGSKELQGLVLVYSLRSKIVVVLTLVFYISTFVYI